MSLYVLSLVATIYMPVVSLEAHNVVVALNYGERKYSPRSSRWFNEILWVMDRSIRRVESNDVNEKWFTTYDILKNDVKGNLERTIGMRCGGRDVV